MSCGLTGDFNPPLPRWAELPGDPPVLRRELAARRAEQGNDEDLPPEPPEEGQ